MGSKVLLSTFGVHEQTEEEVRWGGPMGAQRWGEEAPSAAHELPKEVVREAVAGRGGGQQWEGGTPYCAIRQRAPGTS